MPTLNRIVGSQEVIADNDGDLRVKGARLLGRFRIFEGSEAIRELYIRTGETAVLNALVKIQGQSLSKDLLENLHHQTSPGFALFNSALASSNESEEVARITFEKPKVPSLYEHETKLIAAWSLARMTGEGRYVDYLIEEARPAIEAEPSGDRLSLNESKKALRYLGSVKSSKVREVLEEVLSSNSPAAVEIAIVNLLFNQSEPSEAAVQVLLRELNNEQDMLNEELEMRIAAALDDPQVSAAAEAHDRRTGGDRWRYWGKERGDWPIYNWIEDYVVALNR